MTALTGREPEGEAVEAFLDGARPGVAALAIVGEPGIGKTRLWWHAHGAALARGATVLVARPAQSEAELSFAGLADLLVGARPIVARLPAPQRSALDAALLESSVRQAPQRRVVGMALLSVFRALSAEGEVVVAVDDVQWLDRPSALALEFALRRVGEL